MSAQGVVGAICVLSACVTVHLCVWRPLGIAGCVVSALLPHQSWKPLAQPNLVWKRCAAVRLCLQSAVHIRLRSIPGDPFTRKLCGNLHMPCRHASSFSYLVERSDESCCQGTAWRSASTAWACSAAQLSSAGPAVEALPQRDVVRGVQGCCPFALLDCKVPPCASPS